MTRFPHTPNNTSTMASRSWIVLGMANMIGGIGSHVACQSVLLVQSFGILRNGKRKLVIMRNVKVTEKIMILEIGK